MPAGYGLVNDEERPPFVLYKLPEFILDFCFFVLPLPDLYIWPGAAVFIWLFSKTGTIICYYPRLLIML
jgi:hypothetical protein